MLAAVSMCLCLFFFSSRRRHTRSDRDWSSDVCSSDLTSSTYTKITTGELPSGVGARLASVGHSPSIMIMAGPIVINACAALPSGPGRRDRERGGVGKRVDLGGWRVL